MNDLAELVHPIALEASTRSPGFDAVRKKIRDETFAMADKTGRLLRKMELFWKMGTPDQRESVRRHPLYKYTRFEDKHWRCVEAVYDRVDIDQALLYYSLCAHEDAALLYQENELIVERLNEKLENIGIYSLSRRSDCPVLWAYYANNHTGIIEVFDDSRDDLLRKAARVQYATRRPTTNVVNVFDNLFIKWQSWAYEEEMRAIVSHGDYLHDLSHDCMCGIILGARMSVADREAAISCAQSKGISIYEAIVDANEYAVGHSLLA